MGVPLKFGQGQSREGNGRPVGSKQKVTNQFLFAFALDFEKHGASVIARVRIENPTAYLKVAADMVPRELEVTRRIDELSDEQLDAAIEAVTAILAAQAAAGADVTAGEEPAVVVPPVPEAG